MIEKILDLCSRVNAAEDTEEAWELLKKEAPNYLDPEIYDIEDEYKLGLSLLSLTDPHDLADVFYFCQGIRMVFDYETKKYIVEEGAR